MYSVTLTVRLRNN